MTIQHLPPKVRARIREAQFSPRFVGLRLESPGVQAIKARLTSADAVDGWIAGMRDGRILRAEGHYYTCGVGLWLVGRTVRDVADLSALAAAMTQELVIESVVESAYFVTPEEYLTAERPDGDREVLDKCRRDVLVLSGYGSERRNEQGWAEATLAMLLSHRWDRGNPTIVTSTRSAPESFGSQMFYSAAIMGGTHGED